MFIVTATTTDLLPCFQDQPGEPMPKETFWTLWCKGRLTEADTPTIGLDATPSTLTSAHLHHPSIFLQAGCPSCLPTNSVKALKAGWHKKRLNVALVLLCLFCVVVHLFWLVNVYFCCVRFCFSIPCQEIGLGNISKKTYFVSSGT